MIIVHPPDIAQEARRVGPTLNGDIEEVAVWNLDGFGAEMPPPAEPPKAGPPTWLVLLSALIPVTLLLGYVAKKARE